MRISINTPTGKLVEAQSGGEVEVTNETAEAQLIAEGVKDITTDLIAERYVILRAAADIIEQDRLNTLKDNALNAGYLEADIEVKYVTDEEYQVIVGANKPELTYADLRRAKYPKISDQLDMIYWDKINGTNLWPEIIAAIKLDYPKPEII